MIYDLKMTSKTQHRNKKKQTKQKQNKNKQNKNKQNKNKNKTKQKRCLEHVDLKETIMLQKN